MSDGLARDANGDPIYLSEAVIAQAYEELHRENAVSVDPSAMHRLLIGAMRAIAEEYRMVPRCPARLGTEIRCTADKSDAHEIHQIHKARISGPPVQYVSWRVADDDEDEE